MESLLLFVLIVSAVFIGAIALKKRKSQKSRTVSQLRTAKKKPDNNNYEIWLKVFSDQKKNVWEFDLFGTKAAIAWNDGDTEVVVICVTAFRNEEPIAKTWDYFDFNVKEKYWAGSTPKGSPSRIREELKKIGLL